MTANRSPFTRPTSMVRRAPCSPTSTACSRSIGMPRLWARRLPVPGGQDGEGDRRRCRPRRCTVAPCRRHPRRRAGRRRRRARRARSRARTCSSAPRTRSGRRRRRAASTLRSSVKPTAERLAARGPPPRPRSSHRLREREALVVGRRRSTRRSCASAMPGPDRDVADDDAAGADQRAADHVGRVVHAAVRRATWRR